MRRLVVSLCLGALLLCGSVLAHARVPDIWVDADPGCGGPFYADVDDCWALFHAWSFAAGRIAGVSTVFGNVAGAAAWESAVRWSGRVSQAYPGLVLPALHRGRDFPLERSDSGARPIAGNAYSEAEIALGAFLDKSRPGAVTLLMLGPVTNLAAVLQQKPLRRTAIARVVMLGGQPPGMPHWLPVGGRLRMRDYNVIKDPQAMQVLLDAQIPVDFVPVQAAFGHWLSAADLQTLAAEHPALAWLSEAAGGWERFWRWGFGAPGYPPFDLLASALVFQPGRMECRPVSARMAQFPSITGQQSGLELRAPAAVAGGPAYRRCGLGSGHAADLLRAAADHALKAQR